MGEYVCFDRHIHIANKTTYRGAIRIPLRYMLMTRWRAMHPNRNSAVCEQALTADFDLSAHRL